MKHDYIPHSDEEFNTFFKNITQYVGLKTSNSAPEWTHIPAAAKTALNDSYTNWYTAFGLTLKPHTPVETREKNRVRVIEERFLRGFVNQYLRFPPVTNADRDAMAIPNHDLIRTPHVDVTDIVEFEIKLRNIREVPIRFWIKGATHKAKPVNSNGAVFIWEILGKPPADTGQLTHHAMASKNPFVIPFTEADRGKTVYIAAAWQNERGHVGQWSEIQSAVIP